MAKPYLPTRESELVTWTNSFQSTIVSAFADYGLSTKQAEDYTAAHTAFVSAYQVANDSTTRSPANIVKKNTAKTALVDLTRELVDVCQAWPEMTNDKREELQITLRGNGPTPVPPPDTAPTIDITSVSGLTINLRLHNGDSTKRAKPEGVAGATVFSFVGDAPPVDLKDWKFEGNVSQTITSVTVDGSTPPGSRVFLTSFWFNRKSESGPAATPISTLIQGGGVLLNKAA